MTADSSIPTTDQVLALALAIMPDGRNARLLTADNRAGEWVTIESAVMSGQAFTVELRDGLVALDLDGDPATLPWLADAEQYLRAEVGCAVVRAGSGRDLNEHLFAFAPVGWSSVRLRDGLAGRGVPKGQIRWGSRTVRPPLSPHRRGHAVRLLEPPTVPAAIQLLRRRPGSNATLGAAWRDLIEHSTPPGPNYLTADGKLARGNAIFGLALAYGRRDYSKGRFQADVMSNPDLAKKVSAALPSYLDETWRDAQEQLRKSPARIEPDAATAEELEAVAETLQGYDWVGRSGLTDRAVYEALYNLACRIGKIAVSHSVRNLAETTGFSRTTVNKAIQRLIAADLLSVVKKHGLAQATTYRLLPKSRSQLGQLRFLLGGQPLFVSLDHDFSGPLPDAWRRPPGKKAGPLPPLSYRTWLSTPEGWTKTSRIADLLGMKQQTVLTHLKRLAQHDLVERQGYTWRRVPKTGAELAELASALHTDGAADYQRAKHEAERLGFSLAVSDLGGRGMTRQQYDQIRERRDTKADWPQAVGE